MKKLVLILTALLAVHSLAAQPVRVEVSFTFTRQNGYATNQFAVWIEDARGRHVKTLYATSFTASGGWQRRELSLPQWVKQSGLAGMNKSQVDALTGPTPQSGGLRYVWDGTDASGRAAAAGEYRVFVEATLRNENRVLYTAPIRPDGKQGQVNVEARYFGPAAAERAMIGPVTVQYQF
jgi:hypothetical protein